MRGKDLESQVKDTGSPESRSTKDDLVAIVVVLWKEKTQVVEVLTKN
mgnify:CR=1 FL=1